MRNPAHASTASLARNPGEYTVEMPTTGSFALDEGRPPPQNLGLVATPSKHDAPTIDQAIGRIASAIAGRHARTPQLLLLGIANGGIALARRLAARLQTAGLKHGLGTIDISFHRDDIGRHPIPKEFSPTIIPYDVNGATVILVDDVLYSGRTVKAALAELFDHGRPASVELAVLVDRGGRKLPIAADYCGLTVTASDREKVVVNLGETISPDDAVAVFAAGTAKPRPGRLPAA